MNQINARLENVLLETGYNWVIGVDEVGRGSWAGPVVVAAFVYHSSIEIFPEVNDSKKLTIKRRQKLFDTFQKERFSLASADVCEIDKVNILEATRLAVTRAIDGLSLDRAIVLVDGYFKEPFDFEHKCIVKGDTKHYSIAAASIIAKVYRDNLMAELSNKYPHYGFERNVGYGTREHREALERHGVCEIHRRSYRPIRELLGE